MNKSNYQQRLIIRHLFIEAYKPLSFPEVKCGKSHCIKYLYHILFLFSSKRQHITYLLEISNPNSSPKQYYQTLS